MLFLNVKRILDMRGISRPFTYLLNNGFIRSTAQRFIRGEVEQIRLDHLEQLCLLLNCSPNDLLGWRPNNNTKVSENHPLQALAAPKSAPPISELVKDIPVDKLDKIAELLNQLKD